MKPPVWILLCALACWPMAAQPQAVPGATSALAAAPAALRAYLEQARKADAIPNRYRRCMAFPDWPGNRWAAGAAAQMCEAVHGPRIGAAQIAPLIERGAVAQLEALFLRDLERHFSADDFSEVIHLDFAWAGDGSAQSGRLTKVWLDLAPHSAFANLARARYFATEEKAPDGDAERVAQVRQLVEKALQREPRLMPGWVALIEPGALGTERAGAERAFAGGAAIDPHCRYLAQARMRALAPGQGGSEAAMQAYASQLQAHLTRRPLLSLAQGAPALEKVRALSDAERGAKGALLEAAANNAPDPRVFSLLIGHRARDNDGDWQRLAHLLAASRYVDDSAAAASERGWLLLQLADDPGWALAPLQQADRLEPGNLNVQFLLGVAQFQLHDYASAEPRFKAALASRDYEHEGAMFRLMLIARLQSQWDVLAERAQGYTAAYPQEGEGWYHLAFAKMKKGDEAGALAAYETLLAVHGAGKRPVDARQLERVRRYLAGERERAFMGAAQ